MAQDTFTDTNGTHLLDHTSEMTWTATISNSPDTVTIQSNAVQLDVWADTVKAFASTSQVDSSQITHKSTILEAVGAAGPCVRMPVNSSGYSAVFSSPTGGNWTQVVLAKNEVYLTAYSGLSYSTSSDHTIKISASGTSTVTLEVFIDGSSIGTKQDASSPLDTGYSGFRVMNNSGTAKIMVDDWTDGAAGVSAAVTPSFITLTRTWSSE